MKTNTAEKALSKWGKHNVEYFIEVNNLTDFTLATLCNAIVKATNSYYYGNGDGLWSGYSGRIISEHLTQLVSEGKLRAKYNSKKLVHGGVTVTTYFKK